MVYIDWNRIIAITPETFSEDDKEELVDTLVWYSPTSDISKKQLCALIKVLQEITKYKSDQVESLMGALDELAAKQGEEVARARQEVMDELDDLKEQLEYQRRIEKEDGVTDDQLRSEVVRLQMQNEELLQELQEREKDIVAEKAEVEKFASQVVRLEREKSAIAHELTAFREESNESQVRNAPDSPDDSNARIEELVELVRQKNKHIMQLLDDIEAVEQNNLSSQVKLKNLQDELTTCNEKNTELTEKVAAMKVLISDAELKNVEITDKNKALESQVEELMEKKSKHDRELDQFAVTLNSRVEEWRHLMDMKDTEISALKEEIRKHFSRSIQWSDIPTDPNLKERIEQQEEEIVSLKNELTSALREVDNYKLIVDELREQIKLKDESLNSDVKLKELGAEIIALKHQLAITEEDVTLKGEEITKLVIQLRTYERSEFGLSEAIDKCTKLERRLADRDAKLESLIATCNHLEIEKGNLEDDNMYMREKLGLSPRHVIDSKGIKKQSDLDSSNITALQADLENARDQIVELKLKNRVLSSKLLQIENFDVDKTYIESGNSEAQKCDFELLEKKYIHIVEENDSLRKGMHEILESIQNQSEGCIEAKSLERLLEALDARHISGWYHPAMRLQAQLTRIQGENNELRNQLRQLHDDHLLLGQQLGESRDFARQLQIKVDAANTPPYIDSEKEEDKPNLFSELQQRVDELELIVTTKDVEKQKLEAEWDAERSGLLKENESHALEIIMLKKLSDTQIESSGKSHDIVDNIIDLIKIRMESQHKSFEFLKFDLLKKQESVLLQNMALQKDKVQLTKKVEQLKNSLLVTEPIEKVELLHQQLQELQFKYSDVVSSKAFTILRDGSVESNMNWESEKRCLLDEMRVARERCHELETMLQLKSNGNNSSTNEFRKELSILASKLAASEVRESAEKQRRIHTEKVVEALRNGQIQFEERDRESSKLIHNQSDLIEKLQRALVNVTSELQKLTISSQHSKIIEELKLNCDALMSDKANLEELLDISRSQCRTLQTFAEIKKMEQNIFEECVRLLRSGTRDQFAVISVSQELLISRENEKKSNCKISELQALVTRLLADNLEKECKVAEANKVLTQNKKQHLHHLKILFNFLNDTHTAFNRALLYPSVEMAHMIMQNLEKKQDSIEKLFLEASEKEQLAHSKEEDISLQLDAIYELKSAFQSDSKPLIDWHNKGTELRLKEVRLQRENSYLAKELERSSAQSKRLKAEIATLEEKVIERDRDWEEKQRCWEQFQVEMCDLVETRRLVMSSPRKQLNTNDENKHSYESVLEEKVETLKKENNELMKRLDNLQKEDEKLSKTKALDLETIPSAQKSELNLIHKTKNFESEHTALKLTIHSLEAIVKQKEATVARYQQLLKKNREDHSNTLRKLQNELKNVHNALAAQSKAYSRLKYSGINTKSSGVEEYITKVQELEEELAEAHSNITQVTNQLRSCQQDADQWKELAEERLIIFEESKERLENELQRCREEIHSYQMELQSIRAAADGGQTQKMLTVMQDMQKKLSVVQSDLAPRPRSVQSDLTSATEDGQHIEYVKRQLKASQDECFRLRNQVRALQSLKRRPVSAKPTENQYPNLVDKIKNLEEMLILSKQHEQELEENGLKKIKSIEEVTRWDERKRYQKNLDKMQTKLKQKEVETAVAIQKLDTVKTLMNKLEREKSILESQLRNMSESARESRQIEQILTEKSALAEQVATLEEELANLQRHENGRNAAFLHAKLEAQERKISSMELSNQVPSVLTSEIDRLKSDCSALQLENMRLKTEAKDLKISFEKSQQENHYLHEKFRDLEDEKRISNQSSHLSRAQVRMSYDSRREVNRVKSELAAAMDRLDSVLEKNEKLEEEVQRLQSQLSLWEEKDMAQSLTKSSHQQIISQFHEEVLQLRAQLTHKTHLLDKVKVLLRKAAAKERALNEKVATLQTMVAVGPALL